MPKTALLILSIVINVWFANRIIDLEQFRYAADLQIANVGSSCGIYDKAVRRYDVRECLENKKIRTSDIGDLLWGLRIFR